MMDPIVLVVGATGQLGSVVVRKLATRSIRVRALVRPDSRVEHLKTLGVELREGDLLDPDSLARSCRGATWIIATANAAVPRKSSDRIDAVDRTGYRHLIDAARGSGVRRFIYTSVASMPREKRVPLFRTKRATERYLIASGIPYTIVRAAAFMDVYFAMLGSDLPIRSAEAPTVERPFWFSQRFFQKVRNDLAGGRANLPGAGTTRNSFIAIRDVAEFLVRSLDSPCAANRIVEAGGPESLSSFDVVRIYEHVLGRRVRTSCTPAVVFGVMRWLMAPFSQAASNLMAMNCLLAAQDAVVPDARETAAEFGIQLTTAERFLRSKLSDGCRADD